jgi:hypothetical protein
VPIADAVGTIKRVDPDCELVRIAKSIGINFGDELILGKRRKGD